MVAPANWFAFAIPNQNANCEGRYTMNKLSLLLCKACAVVCGAVLAVPQSHLADLLWHYDASRTIFADKKAVGLGDILTIIVQENTSTSKDNNTKTSKGSAVDASIETFLYSPAASGLLTHNGKLPALKFKAK